jgi:hypothetical protein
MSKGALFDEYVDVFAPSPLRPTPGAANKGPAALPASIGHASAMIIPVELIVCIGFVTKWAHSVGSRS